MNNERIENVKKIGVLMPKGLGDFIVTLPALESLKSAFPSAELVYIGKPWHKNFLKNKRSPVDRVVVTPPKEGVRNEPEKKGQSNAPPTKEDPVKLAEFFTEMKKEKFDIVIHFLGDGKSANPFIKKFDARLVVGLKNPGSEKIDRYIPYRHYQNEVVRFLKVVSLVGAATKNIEPKIKVLKKDIDEAGRILSKIDGQFIVIHPGADDMRRMWPVEKFAQAADAFCKKSYKVVLTGVKEEKEIVEKVIKNMKNSTVNACGLLSLSGLTGLLSKSSLVVANDTGPLHLARAVGVPTVGIYWLPNVINWGPLTREKNRLAIDMSLECPNCGMIPANPWPFEPVLPECDHPYSFVRNVEVDEVLKKAFSFL